MSNGPRCCILGPCCPPPAPNAPPSEWDEWRKKREDALAKLFADAFGWDDTEDDDRTGNALTAARVVLDDFDLVPKGLGSAIVAAYEPFFAERFKAHPPRAEAAAPADFKEL